MLSMPTDIGLAEARRFIDKECHNTEARLLQLNSQRNGFTDIARIPDEILLDIFLIVQKKSDVKSWLSVTQVCHHWHLASIGAPSLWTNPPTHLHDLTLSYLERSIPLCLNIYFGAKTSTDTAIAISHHMWRVQTLNIAQVQFDLLISMQEALQRLNHQASKLKELRISPGGSAHRTFFLSSSTFRGALFLEKLSLQFVDLDWLMLPLPSLTTLNLMYMDISVGLDWQTFLTMMGAMPLLESIRINFMEFHLHTPSAGAEVVTLPRLSNLNIHGASYTQIRYFISKVTLPQLDQVQIVCTSRESDDDYSPTIQALSSLIEGANFGTLDTILLGRGNFSLCQDIDLHDHRSDKLFSFSYQHCIETEQEAVDIITNSVLRIPSLNYGGISTLVRASLTGYGTSNNNDIVDLFASMPFLESLTLCDEMAMPFIDRLFIPIHTPVEGNIPFANLKVIDFYEEEETQFCSELFQKVVNCLMQRCEYNVPIQELLISWTVTEEELKTLQEIVVDVASSCMGVSRNGRSDDPQLYVG